MFKKFLFAILSILVTTAALAAGPQWMRTLAYPFLGNEFSTTPPPGGCGVENGCFRVENWTAYYLSPGLQELGTAQPGTAPVVDKDGIVHGVYVDTYTLAGTYVDVQLGSMPAIAGDFRPAIPPSNGHARPIVYVTVDPGVRHIVADAIQFRPDSTRAMLAYDVRTHWVVSYVPGHGTVVKDCSVYNDVTSRTGSPELAAITDGDCN